MALDQQAFVNRSNRIGGSEVSIIAGANKYRSPLSLWAEKKGLREKVFSKESGRIMHAGKVLEDMVITEYMNDHEELDFRAVGLLEQKPDREPEYLILDPKTKLPAIECHLDATWIVQPKKGRRGAAIETVEVKTYNPYVNVSASDYPDEWFVQTQIGMHAMNLTASKKTPSVNTSVILAFNRGTGELFEHRVEYDREYCEGLTAACVAWKRRYLDNPEDLTNDVIQKELADSANGIDCIPEIMRMREAQGKRTLFERASEMGSKVTTLLKTYIEAKNQEKAGRDRAAEVRAEILNQMTQEDEKTQESYVSEELMVDGQTLVSYRTPKARAPTNFKLVKEMVQKITAPDTIRLFAQAIARETSATQGELQKVLSHIMVTRLKKAEQEVAEEHRTAPKPTFRVDDRGRDTVMIWAKEDEIAEREVLSR